MNITFFTNQNIDCASGLGRHIPLAKELKKLGHSITILCLHPNLKKSGKRKFSIEGIKLINTGQMHVVKKGNLKYKLNKLQLFKVIIQSTFGMFFEGMKTKTDVIYILKPQPINSTAALFVKFLKNKKLITDCDDYEAKANNFNNKLEQKIFQLFEDNVPKLSKFITVNTLYLRNKNLKLNYPKKRILYLPNGVDEKRFKRIDEKKLSSLKKDLKNKKIVLYFGSMDLKTGHPVDLLIKSFKLVKKEISNVKLLMIGGGTDLNKLKKLTEKLGIKKDVSFLGKINPELIPTYIKLSDVSVDPVSNDLGCEGRSPLKIFESMIMKVITVTGDLIDRSYLLKKGDL